MKIAPVISQYLQYPRKEKASVIRRSNNIEYQIGLESVIFIEHINP